MDRFQYMTLAYPEFGAWGYCVYEACDDRPFVRVISGAHYGTETLASLAGARVCERVKRVAEKYGMQEVAA